MRLQLSNVLTLFSLDKDLKSDLKADERDRERERERERRNLSIVRHLIKKNNNKVHKRF
jgi:hypothetical protein